MIVVLCDDPVTLAPPIVYGAFETIEEAVEWTKSHVRRPRINRTSRPQVCDHGWAFDEHWLVDVTPVARLALVEAASA